MYEFRWVIIIFWDFSVLLILSYGMRCHVVWQIFTTEHPKCQYIPTNCIASHSRCYPTQLLLWETQISLCILYTMRLSALGKQQIIKTGNHWSECQPSDIVWVICIWKTLGPNSSWNCQRFVNPLREGVPIHRLHCGFDFLEVEETSLAM